MATRIEGINARVIGIMNRVVALRKDANDLADEVLAFSNEATRNLPLGRARMAILKEANELETNLRWLATYGMPEEPKIEVCNG